MNKVLSKRWESWYDETIFFEFLKTGAGSRTIPLNPIYGMRLQNDAVRLVIRRYRQKEEDNCIV